MSLQRDRCLMLKVSPRAVNEVVTSFDQKGVTLALSRLCPLSSRHVWQHGNCLVSNTKCTPSHSLLVSPAAGGTAAPAEDVHGRAREREAMWPCWHGGRRSRRSSRKNGRTCQTTRRIAKGTTTATTPCKGRNSGAVGHFQNRIHCMAQCTIQDTR